MNRARQVMFDFIPSQPEAHLPELKRSLFVKSQRAAQNTINLNTVEYFATNIT